MKATNVMAAQQLAKKTKMISPKRVRPPPTSVMLRGEQQTRHREKRGGEAARMSRGRGGREGADGEGRRNIETQTTTTRESERGFL